MTDFYNMDMREHDQVKFAAISYQLTTLLKVYLDNREFVKFMQGFYEQASIVEKTDQSLIVVNENDNRIVE